MIARNGDYHVAQFLGFVLYIITKGANIMANRYLGYSNNQQQSAIESDAHLPTNCFTLGRFGDTREGIVMSLDRGPDQFRPYEPHVLVAGYRIHRDRVDGCIFVKQDDDKTAIVRRAVAHHLMPEGKRAFYTLRRPLCEKVGTSLVKVSASIPNLKGSIHMNGHELRLYTGVSVGAVIGREGFDSLVELVEGENIIIFFEDGWVRSFHKEGSALIEQLLGSEDMLDLRISEAWYQIDREVEKFDGGRKDVVHAILVGMANLLHLTSRFNQRGLGQNMRITLIRDFFSKLSPNALELVHRKVTAILHQLDPSLISMLRTGSFEGEVAPATVTDIGQVRDSKERAKREAARAARAEADRQLRDKMKGSSGGKPKNQTTNPKKLAKLERKIENRK